MTSRYGVGQLHQRDSRSLGVNDASASRLGYRSASPNSRGQYSHAVLDELESQNEEHLEGLSAKVKMLKDITDEVKDSSLLVNSMNDTFENTKLRLRGTMNRMLRMAKSTGVGWKVWLIFFAGVFALFWYVWLF